MALSPSKPRLTREARAKAKARAERAYYRYTEKTYGIDQRAYEAMLDAQGGRCAICGGIPRRRRLAVDHDHNTGQVRGLLCYLCNKYLGQWEGDPIRAHNAALYLASIAADYGPEYAPMLAPLVEPRRPALAPMHLPKVRRAA